MTTTNDLFCLAPTLQPTPYDGDLMADVVVLRYLEDWKIADLLKTRTLYFRREDLLREVDPLEGQVAPANIEADTNASGGGNDTAVQRQLRRRFIEAGPVAQTFTSCWYMDDEESREMYQEFVPHNGVVIFSTIGKLRSLCDGPSAAKVASIAPVQYILFREDMMREDSDNFPMYYKSQSFKHQKELRFMVAYTIYYMAGPYGVYKDSWPEGERVAVDPSEIITEVRMAPCSDREYLAQLEEQLGACGLAAAIRPSRLHV